MMLQFLFGALMGFSLLYGLARGTEAETVAAMLGGAGEAVASAIAMAGGFAFFCGMLSILRRAGAAEWMGRRLSPLLRRLLGPTLPKEALESAALNLTANLLGLGNAATPMGVKAARQMAKGGPAASDALCMFLVINSSSVQLLPASVIALRAAEGSRDPGAIALPALLATLVSTAVGVISCKLAEKKA